MVRPTPDEIDEQLEQQELDTDGSSFEGEESVDIDDLREKVFGKEPKEDEELDIAEKVEDAEIDIRDGEINDYSSTEEQDEDGDLKIERKENGTEDKHADLYGEDDDLDSPSEE